VGCIDDAPERIDDNQRGRETCKQMVRTSSVGGFWKVRVATVEEGPMVTWCYDGSEEMAISKHVICRTYGGDFLIVL
jgi:hypothetical protein